MPGGKTGAVVACLLLVLRRINVMGNEALLRKMYSESEKYNSRFRSKTYMEAVKEFCDDYKYMFTEMLGEIDGVAADCGDTDSGEVPACVLDRIDGLAAEFVAESEAIIKTGGKQPGSRVMLGYNMYAVMYIFPCIIDTDRNYAEKLTKSIVDKWNSAFKNTNLQYSDYATIDSGFRRKLCYITTAVCEHMGYADDCEELTLLRGFRDGYMMSAPGGKQMVEEYYECAPGIVGAINTRADSGDIYKKLYAEYIYPCVKMIKEGRPGECLEHYKLMVCEWGANIIC